MIILALALLFMIAFTIFAFSVLSWQSADLSVDIESKTDPDSNNDKVVISVLNTAGSTLLFYESSEMTGKIEYLQNNEWVEFCDVCYTLENTSAFSQKYGGTFAELSPGESWKISVPEEKLDDMKNGTYRIKLTYITEDKFKRYIDLEYSNHKNSQAESGVSSETTGSPESEVSFESNASSENASEGEASSKGENVSFNESNEVSNDISGITSGDVSFEESMPEITENFIAEAHSEVFIKTFEFVAPSKAASKIIEKDVSEISE